MTDPETANRTYIGPMTPELVETIIAKARHTPRCAALRSQATTH
jgi:carbamoylphosphate synthase large subunit